MWKSKFYGAFVLNHRVVLHAIVPGEIEPMVHWGADQARMRDPQSDGTRKRGGRSFRGLPPVEACAPTARRRDR